MTNPVRRGEGEAQADFYLRVARQIHTSGGVALPVADVGLYGEEAGEVMNATLAEGWLDNEPALWLRIEPAIVGPMPVALYKVSQLAAAPAQSEGGA